MRMSEAGDGLDEAFRPVAAIFLVFAAVWLVLAFSWIINTYRARHFQTNNLQWALASVPIIKALQLVLSFLFWYSCFYHQICSLWMSFGVYVTGVLFYTASFVSFFLIAHGYCIMCERLSVSERRSTAALGCVFYLTLVGYRASTPYFLVLMLLNYFISFYMIYHHVSQNLVVLRQQLNFIQDESVDTMRDAVNTKYIMFKRFQRAMHFIAVAEIAVFINVDYSSKTYWIRLILREWAQFCVYLYIGWTFRSQNLTPHFSVLPAVKPNAERMVPPIFRIELDAKTFKDFSSQRWQIGVPTSSEYRCSKDSILVVIQHPSANGASSTNFASASPVAVFSAGARNKISEVVQSLESVNKDGACYQYSN